MGAFDKYANGSYTPLPDSAPFTIVYPNADGTSGGYQYNYTAPSSGSSDPYGGTPIQITSGNAAQTMNSVGASLSSDFSGLFDMIMQNTDNHQSLSNSAYQKS